MNNNIVRDAEGLSRDTAFMSTKMMEAILKKCTELNADGFFATIDKNKRQETWGEDQEVLIHFTRRPSMEDLDDKRECQNPLADIFTFTDIVAVLAILHTSFEITWECPKCKNIGIIEAGDNDLPCDCPAGDAALFNEAGIDGLVTGAEVKRHFLNNSPEPIKGDLNSPVPASSLPGRQK